MVKKILFIIALLIIGVLIILISPLSSLILKSALESKIEGKFDAEIDFVGFNLQLLKGIKIKEVSFTKKDFNIEAKDIFIKFNASYLISKKYILNCTAQDVSLRYKERGLTSIISLISDESNFSLFENLKFDYISTQIVFENENISFNNIEATSKQVKLFGNIVSGKETTNYDLDLYLPLDATESMPDLAKVLLNIKDEGSWSKMDVIFSTPNRKE